MQSLYEAKYRSIIWFRKPPFNTIELWVGLYEFLAITTSRMYIELEVKELQIFKLIDLKAVMYVNNASLFAVFLVVSFFFPPYPVLKK